MALSPAGRIDCIARQHTQQPGRCPGGGRSYQLWNRALLGVALQGELAEAEAKAKVIEEARRRRLTLALAATVLLALTLGDGGWLWVKADRDFRITQPRR